MLGFSACLGLYVFFFLLTLPAFLDVVWRGGHDRLDRLALLRLLELDPNLFLEYDELLDLLVLFEAC